MDGNLKFKGEFFLECVNPDGSIAWTERFPNGPTNVGITNALSVLFGGGTQITTWYMGLIDNASFSALAPADTMAAHAGWLENTNYSESVRQTVTFGAAAGNVIATSAPSAFTMNSGVTIHGAFIATDSTKGGTAGYLWATGVFASNQVLVSGQVLRISYSVTGSGS